MAFIEVEHLQIQYATQGRVTRAIGDVSLAVEKGDFLTIVGPSGCGKSTLLKAMGGLLSPSAGRILLSGKPVTGPPPNAIYLFQDYSKSVFPWMSAIDNVAFGIRNRQRHLSRQQVHEQAEQHLELVGLQDFAQYFPKQLSGGMQQRVAIARALICRPEVLLLDEPFGAIDALNRSDLQDLLLDLWQQFQLTILFVTHDIDEAIYVSQRIVSLSKSPATKVLDLDIALPFPRDQVTTKEDPRYLEFRRTVWAAVTGARAGRKAQRPQAEVAAG